MAYILNLLLRNFEYTSFSRDNIYYVVTINMSEHLVEKVTLDRKNIEIKIQGEPDTFGYRLFFQHDGELISPFHDIPLRCGDNYNFIVEIPCGTNAKLEINKEEAWNPIKQDVKNGKLRFITYGNYPFHYGAFPQTWEDPHHVFPEIGHQGDNDPVDVCEIGSQQFKTGDVVPVKVLGCLGMIDDAEADWKIITIATNDPMADKLNNIQDVEEHMAGCLDNIREWFRNYKVPDGKGKMNFGLDEKYQDRDYALNVINQTHAFWKDLISGRSEPAGVSLKSYSY